MKKTLLIGAMLCTVLLGSCGSTKYLKLYETTRSGNLSVKLQSMNILGRTEDSRSIKYRLTYTLHSHYDKTMALTSWPALSVVFDDIPGNGGILMFDFDAIYPNSISPNGDETVSFSVVGFADWKKALVSYNDESTGVKYSFGLNRADLFQ